MHRLMKAFPKRSIVSRVKFFTTTQWEEERQRQEIKSPEFYDEWGHRRRYFYHINLQGQLFIEDVIPKNITTCLKEDKFIDFFLRQLRPNDTGEHEDYPLCSPCGKEMNYVKPADPAGGIVLGDFLADSAEFSFGATFRQPLDPSSFAMHDGRLYHALTGHRWSKQLGGMALIRSRTALTLCEEHFDFGEDPSEHSFVWKGEKHPVRCI